MRKSAKKKTASIKGELIVFLCFIFVLTGMTIGFASYSALIRTQGVITVKPQGIVHFTQLDLISYSNVDTSYQPSFTDTDLDFNLHFAKGSSTDPYSATYQITVQNDTFSNQTFLGVNYSPTIIDGQGSPVPSTNFSYTIDGLSEGDVIAVGSSVTFTVTMTMNVTSGDYVVDGEATITTEENDDEPIGSILAALKGATTGDLRGSNVRAPFIAHVINTHSTAQTFNLLLNSNVASRYKLTDANGNALGALNIPANVEGDFVFYIERLSGVTFCTDSESTMVSLLSTNNERANVGITTLLVDEDPSCNDNEPPVISGVTITQKTGSGSDGKADVSWSGTDTSAIVNYTVAIYDSNNNLVGNPYNTGDDSTTMTITGLNAGTYYAKVYGEDAVGNKASSSDISSCSTASGYCSRSNSVAMKWNYSVTYHLTNITSSNTTRTVLIGTTYTTTISANSTLTSQRRLPDSITVVMGGATLPTSQYTYNSSSGAVSIPNVSGDIESPRKRLVPA